jgi:predicted aspartyl protease
VKLAGTLGLALLASTLASTGAAHADCKLSEIAEFHVDPRSARPIVDGAINGQPVKILFDTGATTSMVPLGEAKRLKLTMLRLNGVRIYGVGGDTAAFDTNIKTLTVDKFTANNLDFIVAGDNDAEPGVSLVLGDDFFSQRDVEFDLREGVVRMFRQEDCAPPQLVYWGAAYSQATVLPWNRDSPTTQTMVLVNGTRVLTSFDTGSSNTVIDAAAAEALGEARAQGAPGGNLHGVGPQPEASWIAHFDSLAIGDEKLSNVRLQVANLTGGWSQAESGSQIPYRLDSVPSMFLGADFFHAHRVFFDNKDRLVLFSYEGGPVFRSDAAETPAKR